MTTYVPFVPVNNATPPWQGQFILDGQAYQAVAWWNFYAQRFYLSLAKQNQSPIWYGPLVGSPLGFDIFLAPGVFVQSTLLYRTDTGQFEVTP